MKFRPIIRAIAALALLCLSTQANAQATILPPGMTCYQATTGLNGMLGLLGLSTGGSLYTNGTYGGVPLTGGSGTGATANITVSGGAVTGVAILNPGTQYVVGDVLSASAALLGGTGSGFSVPVSSTSINSSLAGGTIGYYIPNTLTFKQTWQDAGQSILNTNPVGLDANGCAIVYGAGIYRQIVKDSLGNTVYDRLTASTGGLGIFWAGLAGGTGNAITLTNSAFVNQDGYSIQFLAKAQNTGATTVTISGGSPIQVVQDTSTGPASLVAGQIGQGNTPIITYDATNVEFHLINPSTTSTTSGTTAISTPQGYLNLVGQASGSVVQTGDVLGASTVFYSPYVGSIIPIWNGSDFVQKQFSELTATLTASGSPSNTIQDECVFLNNGAPTLVTGPSWTTVTAGSGARGTGPGSAQLTKLQGIWVNATQIIGYNGLSSFTIPANQCTYVGSIYIDATAGQVTAHRTAGTNRKFGIWNEYNRVSIIVKATDATASWVYSVNTIRASNNNPASFSSTACNVGGGTTCDTITVLSGQPEEQYNLSLTQLQQISAASTSGISQIGIGFNSITTFSGTVATSNVDIGAGGFTGQYTPTATFIAAPSAGINVVSANERTTTGAATTNTYFGTETNMILKAGWNG